MQSAEEYISSLYPIDSALQHVLEGIVSHGMPQVSIAPMYGKLLTLLVRISGANKALEIGSLGGFSGICLLRGMEENGRLTLLEVNPEFARISAEHIENAGFGGQAEHRIGEALHSLRELEQEGRRFDFFFIDADKGNYPDYLEWSIRLSEPGALIVGDNLLLYGKTVNPEKNSSSVQAIRRFNERIASDPRLESTMLPAYDGLVIARVK